MNSGTSQGSRRLSATRGRALRGRSLPVSLRISVTDRCDLRCLYCRPTEQALAHSTMLSAANPSNGAVDADMLSVEEMVSFVRVVLSDFGLSKVHITGGEPLLRTRIGELVAELTRLGVPDVALTTNAQRLAEQADDLRRAGLRRVNISLDSLNPATYRILTRGGRIERTLSGIEAVRRLGFSPVKLNTVVLRGINDDEVVDLARFGLDHDCETRFLELMPIGPATDRFDELFVSSTETRVRLCDALDLRPLPSKPGATDRRFLARHGRGRRGVVAFISADSQPFCRGCRRLRLTAAGRLIGCLGLGLGPYVRPMLSYENDPQRLSLVEAIHAALGLKRVDSRFTTGHLMVQTGG